MLADISHNVSTNLDGLHGAPLPRDGGHYKKSEGELHACMHGLHGHACMAFMGFHGLACMHGEILDGLPSPPLPCVLLGWPKCPPTSHGLGGGQAPRKAWPQGEGLQGQEEEGEG